MEPGFACLVVVLPNLSYWFGNTWGSRGSVNCWCLVREVTRDLVAGCSEYVGGHVNDNTSPAPSQCCVAYFAGSWIGELFPMRGYHVHTCLLVWT